MGSRAKSPPRVYLPDPVPEHGVRELPPDQAHHLVHVLRLAAGDVLVAFDGRGREYDAVITRIGKHAVTIRAAESRAVDRESPVEVVLAQGISSGERMDYTVQKAVELGVTAIQPLSTERSIVRLDEARSAKRVAHWQSVAIGACAQCGRNVVPEIRPTAALNVWLASLGRGAVRLTLAPDASVSLRQLERPAGGVVLLVGPEGGLSPRERETAAAAGFSAIRLGPRVLRTETAAVAALSAMQTLWGDF
ncbi:MAG TPA: 16S rRNA (uracil(1498)-N(3))-methyltransferase [Burkholderiales bacterium]|nr:16S rRNA (uracil(1498)-N(3))-methyltransferase [Burkholderiales bacterium]